MFKLIASDMDGTLLDENGQVPPETYELILALHEHGVHFAASSGRRYDRLCEFFAPVRDKRTLSPLTAPRSTLTVRW